MSLEDMTDDVAATEIARRSYGRDKCVEIGCPTMIEPTANLDGFCRYHRRLRSNREAQARRRERFLKAGLTTHGTEPTGRRVVSWTAGPLHLPRPHAVFPARCANCLAPIRPYRDGGRSSYRHAS